MDNKRINAIKQMINTQGWQEYLKPFIKNKIKLNNNILNIDENNIERSYLKHKVKLEVYKGLLSVIEQWLNKK